MANLKEFLGSTGLGALWARITEELNKKATSADLADVATSGSYNDLEDKPFIPSAVSDLTDDSGHYTKPASGIPASDLEETYLTSFTETDPTVPSWAKAPQKPTYTAAEVGAMATDHPANNITAVNIETWTKKTNLLDVSSDHNNVYDYWWTLTIPRDALWNIHNAPGTSGKLKYLYVPSTEGKNLIKLELPTSNGKLALITDTPAWARAADKPTYTAQEVGALPADTVIPIVPTNVSAFTNDAGYITGYTETDPTVPAWAKTSTKPSYTAAEVGAPTVAEMNSAIGNAIGNVHQFEVEIVQELPVENIKEHTVYFVPKSGATDDVYDEYIYINNAWEMIGNTQIDLSNYATKGEIPSVPVQDVQVDGTSILSNGTANIPIASSSTPGVVSVNGNGLIIDNGLIKVDAATSSQIKVGTSIRVPPVSRQHESVFYGLAKAAGDTTQSASANAVGTYTTEAKAAIRSMIGAAASADLTVQDVQINGTSIVSNGIANIPYGGNNIYGLVRTGGNHGIQVLSSGYLAINGAGTAQIKAGTDTNYPIASAHTHEIAFYGLAKAAGYDEKNSSLAFGTYTNAAKNAIQNMLGITDLLSTEESSTATAAHALNSTFMMGGKLYKATAAIAIGEAVVEGQNCEAVKADEVFVKNTDYADSGKPGIVQLYSVYGITKSGGFPTTLQIAPATSTDIKKGNVQYKPIVSNTQHEAVFYGLAKAAGDSTQTSSSNTVGTYTPEAQSAIKSMIGVGEEAYFINKKDFTNPTTVNSNASSVINAALIAAKTAGKNYCVIPEGEYWLTETIYLQDGVILKGSGMDATTLKIADGYDIDAIRVASPINNSGVMDLSIDGNRITNYSTFSNGHHGNAINVWLHYGRIERVRTNWVYKHSLLLNYDTGNSDDGLGFDSEHQNDVGNLNKVLWCDFRDSLLQGVMWGWRTMDSWMCYTNIGSHAANLYLEGGTSRFIGNHFDGDGDNGAGPEYNVYCGDGCKAMLFDGNIFENTQKQNIFFRQPSYSNQTMTITISNNIIRTCSKSQNEQYSNIYISGYSDSVKATEITITGNQILNPDVNANHGYAGIHLAYCENCKIVGNTFFNVGGDEVIIDSTCDNVLNDSALPKDIQVNGTSVVSNGVANIPVATSSTIGTVMASGNYGIQVNSSTGELSIKNAGLARVKAGTNAYEPIVASHQHESVFYGLAKAAGADMSSSLNAVGTYTETAKTAIRSMIGATSSNVIAVQDTQPVEADAKIWMMETAPESVQVPTMEDLEGYVQKTDYAAIGTYGLVKLGNYSGISLDSTGYIKLYWAGENAIKTGTSTYTVINPSVQHISAFYGLAKAAGDTTQSASSNAVGTYTDNAKTAIRTMIGAISNTDYATSNIAGVVKVNTNYGVQMTRIDSSSPYEILATQMASAAELKAGTNYYKPAVPANIHQATFYGLAKAAGDTTMTSSSNAVGTYTETAKAAIRNMLGVETSVELIEAVSGTTPTIVGQPNVTYQCGEVATISITPPANGTIDVYFTSGSTAAVLTVSSTIKWPSWFDVEALEPNTIYELMITNGAYGSVMTWQS